MRQLPTAIIPGIVPDQYHMKIEAPSKLIVTNPSISPIYDRPAGGTASRIPSLPRLCAVMTQQRSVRPTSHEKRFGFQGFQRGLFRSFDLRRHSTADCQIGR